MTKRVIELPAKLEIDGMEFMVSEASADTGYLSYLGRAPEPHIVTLKLKLVALLKNGEFVSIRKDVNQ